MSLPFPSESPQQVSRQALEQHYRIHLCALVQGQRELMRALQHASSLGLQSWAIGAGVIRSLVWDELHGFAGRSTIPDWDFVYYDSASSITQESELRAQLQTLCAVDELEWDVVNQAHIHHWLGQMIGRECAPYQNLEQAIASWPETATCVALSMTKDEQLEVIAPWGLSDLFELKVTPNPHCPSPSAFEQRRRSKNWQQTWPRLQYATDETTEWEPHLPTR